MRTRARAALIAVLVAIVASLTPATVGGARVALALAPCVDGWQRLPLDERLSALEPQGVATLNGQPAWVVGIAAAREEGGRAPLIGRWTPDGWVKVANPLRGYGSLNAVQALSASSAWAVGSRGSYERWPTALRWDGTRWNSVAVPHPAGELATLVDLALVNGNRLWAVGARLDAGLSRPYALLRSSGGWRDRSPRLPAGVEGGLADVTRAPGGRIWAAGWSTDEQGQGRAWILYRTTSGWRQAPPADHLAGRSAVLDLAFRSANSGWAAGFVERDGGAYQPLLQRWNGSAWMDVAVPWAADRSVVLYAAEVDAAGRLVVAGTEIGRERSDVVATLDGAGWSVSAAAPGASGRSVAMDAAVLPDGALVVGYDDTAPFVLAPCNDATDTTQPTVRPSGAGATPASPHVIEDAPRSAGNEGRGSPTAATSLVGVPAVDVTAAAGIDIVAPTWGGVVADFDADGREDIFIGLHYQVPGVFLYGRDDGTFETVAGGSQQDRHGCAAADVDGSGLPDLHCTIGVNKGTSNTPNELWLDPATDGGTWATADYGVLDGFGRGRDVTFLNLDGDEWPDLYVLNEPSRNDGQWSSNRLYRNVGGEHFRAAPEWGIDHAMGGLCALATDFDADADDDLVTCVTEPLDGLPGGLRIFVNEDGTFVESSAALGVSHAGALDIEAADLNGDGLLDLATLSASLLSVWLNSTNGFVESYRLDLASAASIALGDVNGDARPDIYLASRTIGNADHQLLVNDGSGTGFASVSIPQPGAGRADEVLALDYDANGLSDFLTLNGWGEPGPVKLTAFFPVE